MPHYCYHCRKEITDTWLAIASFNMDSKRKVYHLRCYEDNNYWCLCHDYQAVMREYEFKYRKEKKNQEEMD